MREGQKCTSPRLRLRSVGDSGLAEGVVLLVRQVTPMIRAQKVAAGVSVSRAGGARNQESSHADSNLRLSGCAALLRRAPAGEGVRR